MILAVFVTFKPDLSLLERAVSSVVNQLDEIIIVDNSPTSDLHHFFSSSKVTVKFLGENVGIARAQNIGITWAQERGAKYILLSDQDTIYPELYVKNMLPVFETHPEACVVVPRFIDANKAAGDGFIALKPFLFSQFYPTSGKYSILQAISSGKILNVSCLAEIGLMDEKLFIDWVDLEWCWRARARGFSVIGNADVTIAHRLGDSSKNIGFREVNLRSPMRHYYITRNAFYLALHSNDLDILHRINLFFRSFRYVIGFSILAKPRFKNLKAVLIGLVHGLSKKLGPYDLG